MQSITRTGEAGFRTRLMQREQAARFAKCLAANAQFQSALVCEQPAARGPVRWYVFYVPASPDRQRAILQSAARRREQTAVREAGGYHWVPDPDHDFHHCLSVSGEVYEVTPVTCTCPDWMMRGNKLSIPCKHQIALRERRGTFSDWTNIPEARQEPENSPEAPEPTVAPEPAGNAQDGPHADSGSHSGPEALRTYRVRRYKQVRGSEPREVRITDREFRAPNAAAAREIVAVANAHEYDGCRYELVENRERLVTCNDCGHGWWEPTTVAQWCPECGHGRIDRSSPVARVL